MSSSHPSIRPDAGPSTFNSCGTDLYGPVGHEIDAAMRGAMQKSLCRLRLERRSFSFLEAIYAAVNRIRGRLLCFLVTKHNAAALRGVRYPTFPIIKALYELGIPCLKGQILCAQRRVLISESLILRRQELIRSLQAKYGAKPTNWGVEPFANRGGVLDSGHDSTGHCGPGEDLVPVHKGSPNVEKGGVGTPDSTLRGNHGGEGA